MKNFIGSKSVICPVCHEAGFGFDVVDDFQYFECSSCGLIFIEPSVLEKMDNGESPVIYRDDYWDTEMSASRERAFGPSLARVAELFHYSRIEIGNFLDIGTGPGLLLEALKTFLPSSRVRFFGVELMPPPLAQQSQLPGYRLGWLDQFKANEFDGGSCIEVLEHLTPKMVEDLFEQLFFIATPGSSWIFNTGLADYVKFEDKKYLDPTNRGHVISWSVKSLQVLANKHGWTVVPIPGKTWAFLLEKGIPGGETIPIDLRIWNPVPQNMKALEDPTHGSVMRILGLESARAYSD